VVQDLGLLLFMWLFAIVPGILAWREWRLWFALRLDGQTAPVEVQHHWVGQIGLLSHYYIIYQFDVETPDGEYHFHSRYVEVEREVYDDFLAGGTLMVRYSQTNPALFRLADRPLELIHWTFGFFVGLVWSVFFTILIM